MLPVLKIESVSVIVWAIRKSFSVDSLLLWKSVLIENS